MSSSGGAGSVTFHEVLPKQGLLYQEDLPGTVLCKPKLMPLKSVSLQKLESMQREAQETVKEQEKQAQAQQSQQFSNSDVEQPHDRITF